MVNRFVFQQSKVPPLGSSWGKRFAKHLWDLKLHYHDHRRYNDLMVRECDEAYLCHRMLPDTGAIRLIEDGEFGESDIHDNTNVISIRMALTLMPRNEQWLTAVGRTGDTDMMLQSIEDLQIGLHKKAKTRRNMQKVFKQGYVRGTTWAHFDWLETVRLRRLTSDASAKEIEKHLKKLGNGMPTAKDIKQFTRTRQEELLNSGPVVKPVDYFDVWVEPFTDILNDQRPATVYQTFRPLAKLLAEEDELGKKIWSNLTDICEWTLPELYNNPELAGARHGSLRLFGAPVTSMHQGLKLVPVYEFFLPYIKFDDYEFWDTYFYIALDKKNNGPRLIRVEENPDDLGIIHLVGDHYVDHYTQQPYGISGVQYQLSNYHMKNFLKVLSVTATAHSVFPPNLVMEDAFRDGDSITYNAGDNIFVQDNQYGLDVVKPLSMPYQGAALGQQWLRFQADEMKAQGGVDGMVSDSPARGLSQRKTATEVNADTTSGSFFLDNAAENATELLQQVVMGVFQMSQVNLQPDAEGNIPFEQWEGKRFKQVMLEAKKLKEDRSIQVLGVAGQLNKQQEIGNLKDSLAALNGNTDPRAQGLRYLLTLKLLKKNNVEVPPQFEADPNELVAADPAVQKASILDILQNPAKLQQLLADPEIAQALQQLGAMSQNANAQNSQPSAPGAPPQPAQNPTGAGAGIGTAAA